MTPKNEKGTWCDLNIFSAIKCLYCISAGNPPAHELHPQPTTHTYQKNNGEVIREYFYLDHIILEKYMSFGEMNLQFKKKKKKQNSILVKIVSILF